MTVSIPDVPPVSDPALREFLLKMRLAVVEANTVVEATAADDAEALLETEDTTTPPATTANLMAYAGFNTIRLTWTATEDDVAATAVYENTVNNSTTATVIGTVATLPGQPASYTRTGLANNATRYYWVRPVDANGNYGDFSNMATATTVSIDPGDLGTSVAFNYPTGLGVTSSVATDTDGSQVVRVVIGFNQIADSKLSFYEVAVSENGGSYVVFPTSENSYTLIARANISYDVKVRGVDRNGNRTGWGPVTSHTSARNTNTPSAPSTLTAVVGIGSVYLSWTNPSDDVVYATDVYESTDGTTFTKVATVNAHPGQPGKYARTSVATNTALWYYVVARDTSNNLSTASNTVNVTTAKVLSGDIAVDSVLANSIVSNVTTTNVLNANVINSATSLPATLTIGSTGFSLSTVATVVSDPAAKINTGSTVIGAGKVDIFGDSTLNSWRDGSDVTKIAGGKIAANTISANSIEIGARGVSIADLAFSANSPSTDYISWTSGAITHSEGGPYPVSSGNAQWTGATLYVYWIKNASSLGATTSSSTAYQSDRIVVAVYDGGVKMNANYGRTIIDGGNIKTGSITATNIAGGTITASLMAANSIVATNIVAGTITANEIQGGAISGMHGGAAGGSGATCNLTTGGGKVLVVAYIEIGTSTSAPAGITVEVYEDGSLIGTGMVYCPGLWAGAGVAVPCYISSSSGYKTYYMLTVTEPGSGPYAINKSTIVATELKR